MATPQYHLILDENRQSCGLHWVHGHPLAKGQSHAMPAYGSRRLDPARHEQPRAGIFQKSLAAQHDTHRSGQYRAIALLIRAECGLKRFVHNQMRTLPDNHRASFGVAGIQGQSNYVGMGFSQHAASLCADGQ